MTTTTDVPTATQPDIHINNITDHPGSSWAGAGIALGLVQYAATHPWPTTVMGWVAFAGAAVAATLAALGK